MAFGLSFGMNKTKTKQDTKIDKTETTNQQQTGTQQQTQTGSTSTTGSQSGSSTGTQVNKQTSDNTITNTGGTSTQQQTTQFGQEVLDQADKGLSRALTALFGIGDGELGAAGRLNQGLNSLGDFDAEAFVDSGLRAAQAQQSNVVGDFVRGLAQSVGGTAETNSQVALLKSRAENEAAANMAGIASQLQGQAASIQNDRLQTIAQAVGQQGGVVAQVLNALKGGVTTTTGQQQQTQQQSQSGSQVGTTQTAEQNQSQQSQNQISSQELLGVINQLLQGTTNTQGTENVTGSTSKKGGGFSLGF